MKILVLGLTTRAVAESARRPVQGEEAGGIPRLGRMPGDEALGEGIVEILGLEGHPH